MLSLLVVLPGGLKSRAAGRQSPITSYQSPAYTCSIKSSLTYDFAAQVFVRRTLLLYCASDYLAYLVAMSVNTHQEVITSDSCWSAYYFWSGAGERRKPFISFPGILNNTTNKFPTRTSAWFYKPSPSWCKALTPGWTPSKHHAELPDGSRPPTRCRQSPRRLSTSKIGRAHV